MERIPAGNGTLVARGVFALHMLKHCPLDCPLRQLFLNNHVKAMQTNFGKKVTLNY